LETPVAFLLDGAMVARPSRAAHRPRLALKGLQPHWIRLAALGINLGLWASIILGVRRLIG
jgi:hypothetical protein